MDHIMVETAPDGEDAYSVVLSLTDDMSVSLTEESAVRHALHVLQAADEAVYHAAVVRQLRELGIEDEAIGALLTSLRDKRMRMDSGTPLRLESGVSAFTGEGFLHIFIDEEAVGQWAPPAAFSHAHAVLAALGFADLDTAYLQVLLGMGIDSGRARAVIGDLPRFMTLTDVSE